MTISRLLLALLLLCPLNARLFAEDAAATPLKAKRLLFLGDSITHAGGYVAWIETQLRMQKVDPLPEIINLGLSSETCSGLSEPAHPFPRPDVHERLERALQKIKPDWVVACYGMNDGIYYPFGEERFAAYQDGVKRLVAKVKAHGAQVVLLTPPPFDPHPLRKKKGKLLPAGEKEYAYFAVYENYDDVLAAYGRWLLSQKDLAEMIIDTHAPLKQYAEKQRRQNPNFTMAPDGVHPNPIGHRVLGETILKAWGAKSVEPDPQLLQLVRTKTALLHDAWLSEVGHKRPRVKAGPPLEKAQAKAKELEAQIEKRLQETR